MIDDLYHQEILDHYHHPDHFGQLENPDHVITETNASCGDSFTFFIKLDSRKSIIKHLSFTGQGCAISTATSSLLVTHLIGKPLREIAKLDITFMQQLLGSEITPMRLKCLMLPVKALQKIHSRSNPSSAKSSS